MIEYTVIIGPEADTVSAECRRAQALVEMLLIGALWYGIVSDHVCVATPDDSEYE